MSRSAGPPRNRSRPGGWIRALATAGPPWVAITGTPGVGKSSVGHLLDRRWNVIELGRPGLKAREVHRSRRRSYAVDLSQVATLMRRAHRTPPLAGRFPGTVLLGHLAHLLPVRDVVVLRCHPRELKRRLRSRGVHGQALEDNLVVEALDVILAEAAEHRGNGRLWEVDTTGRSPSTVARIVGRLLQNRPASDFGHVDWLADSWVTEQLLPVTD
ncbi:MAG: adenylate kinase family protein [Thermoplasmata archaeon]|nr:adenylate kinase family protein [Thermoplasmata archaeon]